MNRTIVTLALALSLTGCVGNTTKPDQYSNTSGFLDSAQYRMLKPVETDSGQQVHRYISPHADIARYSKAMVVPVRSYPSAMPTAQVSATTITALEKNLTRALEQGINPFLPVTTTPGKGVLKVESAITGINISDKELAAYEYIPIALLIAGTSKATGSRDQMVRLSLETRVTDSFTGELLMLGVREIAGDDLENADSILRANTLNSGLKALTDDVARELGTGLRR